METFIIFYFINFKKNWEISLKKIQQKLLTKKLKNDGKKWGGNRREKG